jgi:hypothetical protein
MNRKSQQVKKASRLLNEALSGVDAAIANWEHIPLSFTTPRELGFISIKIKEMRDSLNGTYKVVTPGLGRIVTDTWPYTNTLGQKIVEAELTYERLK